MVALFEGIIYTVSKALATSRITTTVLVEVFVGPFKGTCHVQCRAASKSEPELIAMYLSALAYFLQYGTE
jgi:hypothetical protein